MAKPIKETPILYGEDARRFNEKIRENEKKRVSREEYDRIMGNYRKITRNTKRARKADI